MMFEPYNGCVTSKGVVTKCSVFNLNFYMKKIIGFLSFAAVLTIMFCSCKPEVKKEVIVVPAAAPVIIVKDPPEKGTTITLDKNGVKVEAKKVDVTVKKQ
jgi:hypothetical protein